jgi:hypothetical protein
MVFGAETPQTLSKSRSANTNAPVELLKKLHVNILSYGSFSNVVARSAAASNKIDTHVASTQPICSLSPSIPSDRSYVVGYVPLSDGRSLSDLTYFCNKFPTNKGISIEIQRIK